MLDASVVEQLEALLPLTDDYRRYQEWAMTLDQARRTLSGGAGLADLLDAIGTVSQTEGSSLADLLLGLPHPELISTQAALALYRRTQRPLPPDGQPISRDPRDWMAWLLQNRPDNDAATVQQLLCAALAIAIKAGLHGVVPLVDRGRGDYTAEPPQWITKERPKGGLTLDEILAALDKKRAAVE